MESAQWIALALVIVFVINLVPAFMPSTWMVLAFFYIQYDLPLIPLTVSGAIVSGFGRFFLAKGSGALKERFSEKRRADLHELGAFLDERRRHVAVVVFGYCLTPLPTNNLFIAAGLAGVNLAWVLAGFWSARIIADTFWVWTTDQVFDSLGDVFRTGVGSWLAIALQTLGLASVIAIYMLPWAKWLRRVMRRGEAAT